MGWFNSLDLFCSISEIVKDLANSYFTDPNIPVPLYHLTANLYHTTPSHTSSSVCLQYDDIYMENINFIIRGDKNQYHIVTEVVGWALKEIYPSILSNLRDSVSLKKATAEDGNWFHVKEIL